MAEVASAFVSIMPSAKGFGSKLDSQISGDVEGSGKKAGSKWGGALKAGAAVGVAALGAIVVKTLGDSVTAASEAQQAVGGVEAVFGKYADNVLADSKKAAQGLGLSASAYNELITVSGAMLKNKGIKDFADQSKGLVTVGADLAAMFGGSTTQAVEALNSAMRGESDPIEKYGIALNAAAIEGEAVSLGLVKNVKDLGKIKAAQNTATLAQRNYNAALAENGKGSDEALAAESTLIRSKAALTKALDGEKIKLTDSQKATAALSLVQKQSADATGAFGRESNTLAGQQARLGAEWENLKVTLGNALLPALTEGASVVRVLVKNFDTIGPVLATVVGGMIAFKAASLASAAASAVMAAGTAGATTATWSLNAAMRANPIGLVVTLLTALAVGLVLAYKKSDTFRSIVDKAFSAVKAGATALWEGVLKPAFEGMKKGFEAVGKAGTWLWNNALQPAFKFIVGGIASILDLWASMLGTLAKVPGFGWAKDAADAMGAAADKARDMADGIKKIPTTKKITITTVYAYQGQRNAGKERSMGDDFNPRVLGLPDKSKSKSGAYDYGDTTGQSLGNGFKSAITAKAPVLAAATKDSVDKAGKAAAAAADKARTALAAKWTGIVTDFRDSFRTLKDEVKSLADAVGSAFNPDMFGVGGKDAVIETVNGIETVITPATTALQEFMAGLSGNNSSLTTMLEAFKALKKGGASKDFLSSLFQSGNTALASQLAADPAAAAAASNLFGQNAALADKLGNNVAVNEYGKEIRDEMRELKQEMKDAPKKYAKELKGLFGNMQLVLEGGDAGQRAYLRTGGRGRG